MANLQTSPLIQIENPAIILCFTMSIEVQVGLILDLHCLKFYQILLLLYGYISLNPDSGQMQFNDDKIWEPLKT